MPLAVTNQVFGLIDGSRSYETPGALVDLQSYTPLTFSANPTQLTHSKSLIVTDHVIKGRHAPWQEPISGGAESLKFELIFAGTSRLAQAAIVQATNWCFSLMYPTRDEAQDRIKQFEQTGRALSSLEISSVGRPVIFTYGAWMPERRYLVRKVTAVTGKSHHPIFLTPYRVAIRFEMQEDQTRNVDFLNRRYGLGIGL